MKRYRDLLKIMPLVCMLSIFIQSECSGKDFVFDYSGITERQKGVTIFLDSPQYDRVKIETDLKKISELNCNCVGLAVAFTQKRYDNPEIYLPSSNNQLHNDIYDSNIRHFLKTARSLGLRVMFKPHIHPVYTGMRVGGSDPKWGGTIHMKTDADWRKWFGNYQRMLEYYLTNFDFDSACIASELSGAYTREIDWRRLISRLRQKTDIPLTCGFNWWVVVHHQKKELIGILSALRLQGLVLDTLINMGGYAGVEFDKGKKDELARDCISEYPDWVDMLDYVGLTFYFPLSADRNPGIHELKSLWNSYNIKIFGLNLSIKYVESIKDWGKSIKKPILFTEGGWGKWDYSAKYPANWYGVGEKRNPDLQGRCYQAFFDEVFPQGIGVYFWVWGGSLFSPEGEPTESILKQYFGK